MIKKKIPKKSVAIFLVTVIFCLPLIFKLEQKLFANFTHSMPIGLYKKIPKIKYEIGDIIVFMYYDKNISLIKFIAGLEGDEYCTDDKVFWINNIPIAVLNIQKYNSNKARQSLCYTLKKDEILVLGDHPDSYDSRYFGPILKEKLIAVVTLLIEF